MNATTEIPFKQWLCETAVPLGLKPSGLYDRIRFGRHPKPKLRYVNKRLVFVVIKEGE